MTATFGEERDRVAARFRGAVFMDSGSALRFGRNDGVAAGAVIPGLPQEEPGIHDRDVW